MLSIVSGIRVAMNSKGAHGTRMAGSGMSSFVSGMRVTVDFMSGIRDENET